MLGLSMICLITAALTGGSAPPEELARHILEETGINGGLIVHLGCGDGKLTAALGKSKSFLVHGLDRDEAKIRKARDYIRSLGIYGRVSVELWRGKRGRGAC